MYKIKDSGTSFVEIARALAVRPVNITNVVRGQRRSKRIEAEIARALGKTGWNEVVLEARSEIQKKPVEEILQEIQTEMNRDITLEEMQASRNWGPYLKQMRKEAAEAQAEQECAERMAV